MTRPEHKHWKQLINTDYLGAYALEDGQDMVLTIKNVGRELVTSVGGKKEECVIAQFQENVRPMILNRTNMKMIQKIHKTPYIDEWVGKKIQVYQDTTKFGGEIVECLRIRPFVPREEEKIQCESCGEFLAAAGNMTVRQLADYGMKAFGKVLCVKCGKLAREAAANGEPSGNPGQLAQAGEQDAARSTP